LQNLLILRESDLTADGNYGLNTTATEEHEHMRCAIWVLLCSNFVFAADPVSLAVYPVWNVPSMAAAADFDDDGNLDRAELNAANSLTIMLGSAPLGEVPGTGLKEQSFRLKEVYPTGMTPNSVRASDLNGDSILDLVVVNHGSNNVMVFLGRGNATFKLAGTYAVGTGPLCAAVADVNNDTKLDIVVSNNLSADLSILRGKGDGTFQNGVAIKTRPLADSIAVADFNNDGKLDLALASTASGSSDVISVLFGRGDGTFQSVVNFRGISGPRGIIVGERLPGTP
jgi:hypothetical protein